MNKINCKWCGMGHAAALRWQPLDREVDHPKVRRLAEKLFRAEQGPSEFPFSPWGHRPQLSDLWPADQERYVRMAESLMTAPQESPDAKLS